jgi:hypothetical protein
MAVSFAYFVKVITRMIKWPKAARLLKSIQGVVFFGVPSHGMSRLAIQTLLPMVRGQPNELLLQTLGPDSQILRQQCDDFSAAVQKLGIKMQIYYETKMSPTAQQVSQSDMSGNLY